MNDPHADPTLWTPEDFLPHDPEQRAAMWRARALALLEQLETAQQEIARLKRDRGMWHHEPSPATKRGAGSQERDLGLGPISPLASDPAESRDV